MKARRFPVLVFLLAVLVLSLPEHGQVVAGATGQPNPTPAPVNKHGLKNAGSHQTSSKHAKPPADPSPTPLPIPALKPGEWEAFVDPEQQIFPSLLLASATLRVPLVRDDDANDTDRRSPGKAKAPAATPPATKEMAVLGEPNGLIGVALCNPEAGSRAELKVQGNAFMEESSLAVTLPVAGEEYRLLPKINYKYDALNVVRQTRPINIVYTLKVNGKDMGRNIVTARVRPINDCPFAYQNPDDETDYTNISWMFAAYVNEDDPAIAGLLKEAQDTGIVDGFDAYQSGDPGQILLQVFAVWSALQKHGIKYSDIGTTAADSDSLYTMHVRFIEESLAETHANCVDASVLLASVLRRMGIEPFLVVEPDHMFLGFYLDAEGKDFACLETTMLGDPDPSKYKINRFLAKCASKEVKKMKGWGNFNEALDSASREYQHNKKKFGAEKEPRYSIVDIEAARHDGIAPIAYLKGD